MDQTLTTPWTTGQKIAFRFAFLFFGFTTIINWTLTLFFAGLAISKKSFPVDGVFKWMSVPFSWLDRHLFHTGYDPKLHGAFPQDNHFGSVFYLAIFLISTIAVIIWSIAGKNKRNYPTLSYWFNLYLRYTLAITIIGYGIDKVIPVQMSWPTAAAMLSNYGEQDRFSVLWRFMGMSPGYMILTGACEVIAGLLLFSRRTLLLGYLILLSILVNVVALNWFYNVPVKMYSAQLMLYNLYLLAPYSRRLFQFFFFDRIVPVPRTQHANSSSGKTRALTAVLIVIPLLLCLLTAVADYKRFDEVSALRKSQKCYNVTTFFAKDTLPPLTTDTLRWKRLLVYGNRVLVCNMSDEQDRYTCDLDSVKGTMTFHDNPDKTTWSLFHYSYPQKGQLQLVGKWKGKDIQVTMQSFPVDSIPLNKEEIRLIRD
jgi:hypothetical protein